MSAESLLLSPVLTAAGEWRNRVVMAPMSRRRSKQGVPGISAAQYYGQRAGAGLIITENTAVAVEGVGYLHAPGIYNQAQQNAWQRVAAEVHARGGTIFMQLVHTGRVGHPFNNEDQAPLVAPSAVAAAGSVQTPGGQYLSQPIPLEMSTARAQSLVNAHVQAAVRAVESGFDGVEIHGAHGFLPEQFLNPHTNHRADEYGGSIAGRSRFLLEIMEGVAAAIGRNRTGVRLSPFATLNDMAAYGEEAETHLYVIDALRQLDILYVHLSDQSTNGCPPIPPEFIAQVRWHFPNLLLLAGGYTYQSAEAALRQGTAELIAFGRPFIANPDLVERFRHQAPLAAGEEATYYAGGDRGYIDYPALFPAW